MPSLYENPALPFNLHLHSGVHVNQKFNVKGTWSGTKDSFNINMMCGSADDSTIAFQCSVRFDVKEVWRNTRAGGQWANKEKNGMFPFKRNTTFRVEIVVLPDRYQVFVDNVHFCDYSHRIPINNVTHFSVNGGVNVERIRIEKWKQPDQYVKPKQYQSQCARDESVQRPSHNTLFRR